MRRILIVLAAFIAAVILGALFAPSLIDVNKHRPQIEAQLQSKLSRPVSIGTLTLHLLPLSVRMDNITIGESPEFPSQKPFATAQDVSAQIELFSLIRGEPVIDSLSFNRPQIELIRNAKGIWNFSTLGGSKSSGSQNELTLKELRLQDGQVALTDDVAKQPRTVYDHVDLRLSGYSPHRRFPVELGLHLPGQGDQLLVLNANVGPVQPGDASTPIDGQLSLKKVSLSGVSRFFKGGVPPNTDALVSGEARITSTNELLSCKGNLKLENITIRGARLTYPIQADYDLTDDRKHDVLQIRSGNIKIGSAPVAISGTVDAGRTPSNLNLRVNVQNTAIQEILHLAAAFGIASSPSYQIRGNMSANFTAQGPSGDPQLSGSVSASQVEISGGEIKQPVRISQISMTLLPDSIRAAPFTAQAGATNLNVAFTLSQYTASQNTTGNRIIDATFKTDNANVAEVIDMAKAYGVEDAKGVAGTGKISLDVHVQGPAAQPSRLVYAGSGSIAGATLAAPGLSQKIAISTATLRFAQNSASLDNLAATVGTTNVRGSISVSDFSAPKVQFNLAADHINTTELQQVHAAKQEPHASGSGMLDKITGSGALTVGNIIANEILLNNVRATCTLNRGVVELSPLTADVFGGKEAGTVIIDTRPATPLCTVRVKLSGLDANKVLSAVSSVKDTLYGSVNGDSNLSFALANSTDLARTMNGTLGFNVNDGLLKNVNILNELSRVGQFMGNPRGQSQAGTAIKRLSGSLDIRNGVASTNDLIATLAEGSLSGKGVVNLADQGINMRVSAVLNSGVSNAVGGSQVGGFLNTALANNKGELVIPVLVTGSLAKPTFAPDVSAIAEMKMKNLLPTTGDPAKLSSGLLNSVLGNKSAGTAGTINQVLQGLTGQPSNQKQSQDQNKQAIDALQSIFGSSGKNKKKTTP